MNPIRAKALGLILKLMGIAFFLATGFWFLMGVVAFGGLNVWAKAAIALTFVCLAQLAAAKIYKYGKRYNAVALQTRIAKDKRPPVIYLRSFSADAEAAKGKQQYTLTGGMGGIVALGLGGETEEEQLAKVMNEIGPFVAVGKPGELLPEIGALRMYVADDQWKDRVLELMLRARLVVLRAGDTEGFWWEFETAAKRLRPESIIVLLPHDATQYRFFRQRAESYIPCALPDYPRGTKQRIGSIRGILCFAPNWEESCFLNLEVFPQGIVSSVSDPLTRAFKATLEPILNQHRVKGAR